MMFFCGNNPDCISFNSKHALNIAKEVVDKHYSVVGVLEHLVTILLNFEGYLLIMQHIFWQIHSHRGMLKATPLIPWAYISHSFKIGLKEGRLICSKNVLKYEKRSKMVLKRAVLKK